MPFENNDIQLRIRAKLHYKHGCKLALHNNYIYDNIHDYFKKSVKTAFFMCLVSSRQSYLVNEPKFPGKGVI